MRGPSAHVPGDALVMRLATLVQRRQAFLAVGALTYALVFALFLILERPGLGIASGFYLAVIFLSLAGGPIVGLGAGLLATFLYGIGIWINPHVSAASIPTLATSIRGCCRRLVRQSQPDTQRAPTGADERTADAR